MLCVSGYSTVIQLYTRMYIFYIFVFFFRLFSIVGYYKIFNIVPILYSKSLLFIYFTYGSVYMLIPNS